MTPILRPLVFAAVLATVPLLSGCEPAPAAAPQEDAQAESRAHDASDFSVFALDGEVWVDQTGQRRALGSLEGRTHVLAMVYTHCHHTCPQIVADMKWLEGMTGSEVGFVLVSLDPERDDPEQLARYADGLALDPDRWTLLMGSDDDTRALAALLGVRYRQEADREIAHTNELTVLGPEGRIVHQRKSLDEDLRVTVEALRGAAGP